MRNEVLRLEKVTLRERGVTQLDNLNLHIFEGEILGLVPIDTHGLTALCDLLRENLPLHYGYVFYREKLINTWRSPQPHYNRISIIQAKSCLVDGLSVADNIFVLRPGFRGRLMRPAAFRAAAGAVYPQRRHPHRRGRARGGPFRIRALCGGTAQGCGGRQPADRAQ